MPTTNLLVKGKVQGVFFREEAKKQADNLHLNGWIKNHDDGHVEIMIKGSDEDIKQFIDWCHKGPEHAEVTDVIVTPLHIDNLESFEIIR